MLLNLSNHPSDKWSAAQREAAEKQYGNIVDMPFPSINPAATKQEVTALAAKYSIAIQQTAAKTVHLMGEMTFTFALVKLLRNCKIACVASTSARNSIINLDGTKTIQFDFVQFRSY